MSRLVLDKDKEVNQV